MYKNVWNHLSNIRFEVDGQSVESDNIIICTRGIYTIEVKNYGSKGNYSIQITKDGQWIKVSPNGKSEAKKDVTTQMNRHIAYKQNKVNSLWDGLHGKRTSPFFFSLFL
jgi:ribosomal protein L27